MSAKRSRDQFGRFSSGASGTALAQFGNEDMRFKKPRGESSVFPTPGDVGRMNVGNEPPNAASLSTGYSSGVIDLGSNSTSSVPVQARKWSPINNVAEMSPSAIVFVRRDGNMNKYKSVADLPTMQWLMRKDRDILATTTTGSSSNLSAGSFAGEGGVLDRKGGWNLLGILRNTYTQGSAMITLCNVDVFGRSKVPCIFGDRVATGQRVGLALIPVNLRDIPFCVMGPGSGARNLDNYMKSLTNDAVAKKKCQSADEYMSGGSGAYEDASGTHVWQWFPTLDGKLCKHVWDMVEKGATTEPGVDFIHHVSLGCISNAHMAGRAPEMHQKMALFDSNKMTTLPTIEILME